MSFLPEALRLHREPLEERMAAATGRDALRALERERVGEEGFLALLSPAAGQHLEAMAGRARDLTLRRFGRTVSLFTPLYVSNHCANHCRYCGFAAPNSIPRSRLTMDEVRAEGDLLQVAGTVPAKPDDFGREFLDMIIAARIVDGVDGAIAHIRRYGSSHTESILTENDATAARFFQRLDSAILMRNASTQFADGGEFGMGAEIGIATGKMHARGPVGAEQLTSFKYLVTGNGSCRA